MVKIYRYFPECLWEILEQKKDKCACGKMVLMHNKNQHH